MLGQFDSMAFWMIFFLADHLLVFQKDASFFTVCPVKDGGKVIWTDHFRPSPLQSYLGTQSFRVLLGGCLLVLFPLLFTRDLNVILTEPEFEALFSPMHIGFWRAHEIFFCELPRKSPKCNPVILHLLLECFFCILLCCFVAFSPLRVFDMLFIC